jgi:hypothetical protein
MIDVEDRLSKLFRERHESVDTLAHIVETDPSSTSTRVHQVTRAREVLVEHEREFWRMKVHPHPTYKISANSRLVSASTNERPGGFVVEYESSEVGAGTI